MSGAHAVVADRDRVEVSPAARMIGSLSGTVEWSREPSRRWFGS
jgi:hypothetical protein